VSDMDVLGWNEESWEHNNRHCFSQLHAEILPEFSLFFRNTSGHTSNGFIIFMPFPHNSDVAKLLPLQHSVKLF